VSNYLAIKRFRCIVIVMWHYVYNRVSRARRKSAEQDNLGGTASVRKNSKEVLPMAKNVLSRITKFVPASLVTVSWLAFVGGICTTNPITKIALLSLARVLP
jgi:hypothetical protein